MKFLAINRARALYPGGGPFARQSTGTACLGQCAAEAERGLDLDPSSKTTMKTTCAATSISGANALSQLDDAKRHADALKAETAALKKEVAGDVAEIRRLKGDPGAQDAAYNRMFDAIRGAQSDIESNLQAIIQIGRSFLATAGR